MRGIVIAALLCLGAVACSADQDRPPPPGSGTPTTSADEHRVGTPIRLVIGEQTLTATVWETPTGAALLDQLPLTLTFADLNGVEKVAPLPRRLTMDQMPAGADAEIGDLGYYAPTGDLVLYYGEVGFWNGIARIGRIDGDLSIIADRSEDFVGVVERTE
ncbi:cyclophilin-like fold protein [Nocardia sp. NPDC058658]|uniref:cyclophilin-like fold protein n=1 Tax=Nocardia sp. NPDC058658 TaxID=3346580 RepID=UPI003653C011